MSIPLVQEATKDAINTSIIAIKRNIERINMLLGLSNSEEIDTSEFVKKSDIVDEVTVGNMQSVTSNAVAECCPRFPDYAHQIIIPNNSSSWIATEDCYVIYNAVSTIAVTLKINNNLVSNSDSANNTCVSVFLGYVKKGDVITCSSPLLGSERVVFKVFPLL